MARRRLVLCIMCLLWTQRKFSFVEGNSYAWSTEKPQGNASVEYLLKQHLLKGYDITSRPVRKDSTPVDTKIGMSLFHILDTNERHQTISAQVSIRVHWSDEYLKWDVKAFPIAKFWIPAKSIWRPDLIITNYANDEYSDYMNTNAIVDKDGKIMWTFPIVVKMYCTLDVRYFPFDTQECNMTFVSWTYDGFKVALNHTGQDDQKVYYNAKNQEWKVTGITPHHQFINYPCCPEPFPVINFTIHMYRRCLFYVINLICPCLLIYFVSFLGFYLPIESGEKVNLEITVLLALVVFLLMVSETMPPTPDAIPILGLLFTLTMTMVALAVVMAVVVTQVFFSQPQERPAGYAMRLSRLHRRWTQQPRPPHRLQAQKGIARLRRVDLDAVSLDSFEPAGPSSLGAGVGEVPPSALYFKGALAAAGNGCLPPGRWRRESHDLADGVAAAGMTTMTPAADAAASAAAAAALPDYSEDWKFAAFALDRIFFWTFSLLTFVMSLAVCGVAYPAFSEDHW